MPQIISRVVEVYLFRCVDGAPQYLLLKRSGRDPLYPGIWQVVTGTLESQETAVAGAKRELREETGLDAEKVWTVPGVNSFYDASTDSVNLCPMFAGEVSPGKEPRLSAEHEMYGWFDHERARTFLVWPSQKQGLDIVHAFIASGSADAALTRVE